MTRINVLLLSFVIIGCQASAQTQPQYADYIKNNSPLTPNSASLGKYGDIPVSLYTGVPNIEVPLYEIDVKGFKLPISLSYHAGGIKVEEIASWVGLGWSLNAGGVINRIQRGMNDELMLKKLNQNDLQTILSDPESVASKNIYSTFYTNNFDLEPDIFNYNFAGQSGKFFSDMEGKFYTMPANKLQFKANGEITYIGTDESFYGRWVVKDNEGITYVFGKALLSDSSYNNAAVEISRIMDYDDGDTNGPNYTGDMAGKFINSWYLKEIIFSSGEKIEFNYEAYTYTIANINTETYYHPVLSPTITQSVTRYRKALRIKEILFPGGKVNFIKSIIPRHDLMAEYALDKIEIFEKINAGYSLLKYFKFRTNNPINETSENKRFRLRLESVTEFDKNNTPKPPHSFQYYFTDGLPDRDSKAQDLWGYFNGEIQNTTLVPAYTNGTVILEGAVRNVNPAFSKYGVLTKIIYPTGGYTTFDYENHTAKVISAEARELLTHNLKGAIQPIHMLASSENVSGNTISYGEPVTISNPNSLFTKAIVGYTFDALEDLTSLYTTQLNLNFFINVSLEKRNPDGSFSYYNSRLPVTPNGVQMQLENGTYRIRLAWTDPNRINAFAQFSLSLETFGAQQVEENTVVDVGGLRIKEIKDFSVPNTKVQRTRYDYTLNSQSSGLIRNVPVFFYKKNEFRVIGGRVDSYLDILHRSSVSQSPLLTAQGGIVGYQKVTVFDQDENEVSANGSVEYMFTSPLNFPDVNLPGTYSYPFPPSTNYDWVHGLSKEITYNKYVAGLFKPVKKDVFNYINYSNTSLPDFKVQKAVKIYLQYYLYGTNADLSETGTGYVYDLPNGMPFLQNKTTSEYDASGNVTLTQTTNYTLSNKALQTATESTSDSKGETWTTYNTYASDLYSATASGTDALAIKNLVDNHNKKNDLIEKYTVKTNALNEKYVVSGTLYKYGPVIPLPTEVNALELISPLSLSSFTPAVLNSSRQLQVDSRYKPLVNYAYDPASYNIVRQARTNGPNTGMLWGYNNSFPIATAVNAANNEIFYQDFEQGGFTAGTAHTGKYYGPDNYTVSYTRPGTTRSYSISYWYLEGGVWKFSGELDYTGPTMPLPLGTAVDDVRISPKDALMTTYTYDPLTGVTSVTDAKGLTQYYNYDSYGRLSIIKNALGEIVKKYDYHYQGQPLN